MDTGCDRGDTEKREIVRKMRKKETISADEIGTPIRWQRWNKAELAVLREHYASATREELMFMLPGRTWCAICHIAEHYGFTRPQNAPRSPERLAAIRAHHSAAQCNRTAQPFAGKHHSSDAKLRIGVSNLFARGHSIGDIAKRKGIAEEEVKKIIRGK